MDIKAPTFPESIADGSIAQWHHQEGAFVNKDDLLVDIETDKVVIEVYAPADGVLMSILKNEGETVLSDETIGSFDENGQAAPAETENKVVSSSADEEIEEAIASPAARKLASEKGVDLKSVSGSGKGGRITKEDVEAVGQVEKTSDTPTEEEIGPASESIVAEESVNLSMSESSAERIERRVPMTRLRASIAKRLVEAQQNAAMLTTFNEVDMSPIMTIRKRYQDEFQRSHNGTRLGFMSFFVRAATEALKRFPAVNASIDGEDIIYHGYYDIGVAVSTDRGLVVPVLRDTDALGLAQIESEIISYGEKARENKLSLEDLSGGTFTITNGGIFGSLMSTPILNAPQTGVLGMHNIVERPMVIEGEIVVRPMMYLALSYDHRLIDGKDAVQFLVAIKGMIEDPARILLEL
tara:strand:- start:141 stop:1370 length:1230 start_codon:yes stop_codon:yes gene_type:complete